MDPESLPGNCINQEQFRIYVGKESFTSTIDWESHNVTECVQHGECPCCFVLVRCQNVLFIHFYFHIVENQTVHCSVWVDM